MTVETVRHWRYWTRPNVTRGIGHDLTITYDVHGKRLMRERENMKLTLLQIWRKLDAWETEQDPARRAELADELRGIADAYPQWATDITDAGIQV